MPQRDGTGPQGKGPKTGRVMGPCATDSAQKNDKEDIVIPSEQKSVGRRPRLGRRRSV